MGAQLDALLVKLASGGTPWKRAVDLATTANITLSGLQTIDGQTTVEGRRVLVKDQAAPAQNGVYIARTGTWTRAEDMDRDSYAQIGTVVRVMRGTANGGKLFYISAPTSGDIRIGSTSTTWSEWAGGASGVVAPTADTVPLRDTAGELYATSFQGGATGSTTVAAVGATSDITIDAGRDVIIDVGSTSDEIAIKAGGVTKATIVPGAVNVAIATATDVGISLSASGTGVAQINGASVNLSSTAGALATLRADASAVVIGDDDEPDALTITPNGGGGTTTIAGFQPLSLSAAGAMTVQPAQATSGAGHKLTVGGGSGQTPGTHLAGGIDVQLGQVVSNNSAGIDLYAGATHLCQVRGALATYTEIAHQPINSALLLRATSTGGQVWCQANNLVKLVQANAANGFIDMSSNRTRHFGASDTTQFDEVLRTSVLTTTDALQTLLTLVTTSNRAYTIVDVLKWSNDTDDKTGGAVLESQWENVAGTLTQVGATTALADHFRSSDTGIALVDLSHSNSGTSHLLRVDPSTAKTRNWNITRTIYERVIA